MIENIPGQDNNRSDMLYCRAPAAGTAFPTGQQASYAVASANAAPYSAQRTGYDQAAYQAAAATQPTYAGKLI